MIPSKGLLAFLAVLLLVTSVSAGPIFWQSNQDGLFFEETGHTIRGSVLEYWLKAPDPLLLFGFPITRELDHPIKQGYKLQYFQRARMEWDSNSNSGVELVPLGSFLYDNMQRGDRPNFAVNNGACRMFPNAIPNATPTSIPVCYAFLQFYDAHQGMTYFGLPISEVEIYDNRLVQYFEYARMEWRPENESGRRVALTDIGRLNFDIFWGNSEPMVPDLPVGPSKPLPTKLEVYAFTDRPLVGAGEQQIIFVVVKDQYKQPVKDALVMVTVQSPDGKIDNIRPDGKTNEDGLLQVEFPVNQLQPNDIVKVIARANVVNGPEGEAETMFRIWW